MFISAFGKPKIFDPVDVFTQLDENIGLVSVCAPSSIRPFRQPPGYERATIASPTTTTSVPVIRIAVI